MLDSGKMQDGQMQADGIGGFPGHGEVVGRFLEAYRREVWSGYLLPSVEDRRGGCSQR